MYIYSGQFKNRRIASPEGLETRPTSGRMRETLFNICQTLVEGSNFLDLFAGTGVMGLEALSRGAATATFVDHSFENIRAIKENIKKMGLEAVTTVIHADIFLALERLQKNEKQFDLIFADPPYEHIEDLGHRVLTVLDGSALLKPTSWVFLEESAKAKVATEGLVHLKLHSYRKAGRSSLYEFNVAG